MKLVGSYFNDGVSLCEVQHKKKIYLGISRVHPDDLHSNSMIFGGSIAEKRAQIKALKDELKEEKSSCDECRNFVKACTGYKNFDKNSPTAKAMFTQLNKRIKRVNQIVDHINELEEEIQKDIQKRDIVVRALSLKKNKHNSSSVKND